MSCHAIPARGTVCPVALFHADEGRACIDSEVCIDCGAYEQAHLPGAHEREAALGY